MNYLSVKCWEYMCGGSFGSAVELNEPARLKMCVSGPAFCSLGQKLGRSGVRIDNIRFLTYPIFR